jgi:hypothetical protein
LMTPLCMSTLTGLNSTPSIGSGWKRKCGIGGYIAFYLDKHMWITYQHDFFIGQGSIMECAS